MRVNLDENLVEIDDHDFVDLCSVLSRIVLPALEKFRHLETGAPHVDEEDVPEELKGPCDQENYELMLARWRYVLGEMIWAHRQVATDDGDSTGEETPEAIEAHELRKRRGLHLFGKYYQGLWT